MKIRGWLRVGIAITVLWVISFSSFVIYEYVTCRSNGLAVSWTFEKKEEIKEGWSEGEVRIIKYGNVIKYDDYIESTTFIPVKPTYHWNFIFFMYLVVPAFSWLISIMLVKTILWIKEGFNLNP